VPPDVRRRIVIEAVVVVGTLVVGGVLIAVKAGTGVTAAGIVVMGLGFVGGTAAVFAEIGFSEDRERAEAERRRDAPRG
jgi:hypothetical protein